MHYLVPGPTPCPEVVAVFYIRPAEVLTLFKCWGRSSSRATEHRCRVLNNHPPFPYQPSPLRLLPTPSLFSFFSVGVPWARAVTGLTLGGGLVAFPPPLTAVRRSSPTGLGWLKAWLNASWHGVLFPSTLWCPLPPRGLLSGAGRPPGCVNGNDAGVTTLGKLPRNLTQALVPLNPGPCAHPGTFVCHPLFGVHPGTFEPNTGRCFLWLRPFTLLAPSGRVPRLVHPTPSVHVGTVFPLVDPFRTHFLVYHFTVQFIARPVLYVLTVPVYKWFK